MKIFAYKKVKAANLEYRRELMQDLHRLKSYSKLNELKRYLRCELRKTYEQISYYLNYRGVEIYLGDQFDSNKFLGLAIDPSQLVSTIQKQRKDRQHRDVKFKEKWLKSYEGIVHYNTENGTMTEPGHFYKINKKIRSKKAWESKYPTTKDPYVGIELEYASSINHNMIAEMIAEVELHDKVKILTDGSIKTTPNFPYQVELCLLSKFSELDKNLQKLSKIIDPNTLMTNLSCGFHVHLDARNFDVKKMFHNLVCMQSLLFKMASEVRTDNRFCRPMNTSSFDDVNIDRADAHYDAISKFAFYKHKTVEVRIHESTLDMNVVEKWVRLLHKIAYYNGSKLKFGSLEDSVAQIKNLELGDDLTGYVDKRLAL